MNAPKQLNVIIDRDFADKVSRLGASCGAIYKTITVCKGTASSRRLAKLGLGETEKALITFLAEDGIVQEIISVLRTDLKISKEGHGIAFAVPLSGVVGGNAAEMIRGRAENQAKGAEKKMENKYELIVAVFNRGYAETAMQAAKDAGAQGGTIIKARGTKENDEAEFLGVPIQAEKDVLYILVRQEEKGEIMQAIVKAAGLTREGRGICYSMPVSDIAGISRITG
ncbi:MAG: P-II family nitrogen regulator [Clostridiales bacterium]|jgi:nitrogen regulatory protein PII|nr:P-II family nitrogen regulator [Clostridiales bacterium]